MSVYLETNALVGIAADQQPGIADVVFSGSVPVRIPSSCVMEAYGAVAFKGREIDGLIRALGAAIHDYGRNPGNVTARGYVADLSTAQASIALIQNDMQIRLADCIDRLAAMNAFFHPSAFIIQQSAQSRVIDDPTDNLIALSILDDAISRRTPSAFYTQDRKSDSFASLSARFAAVNITLVHDHQALMEYLAAAGFSDGIT